MQAANTITLNDWHLSANEEPTETRLYTVTDVDDMSYNAMYDSQAGEWLTTFEVVHWKEIS